MKQLTAIEWLKEKLPSLFTDDSGHYKELFQQALLMEKEQIIGAYIQAKMENLNMPDSMKYYDILEQNKIKAEKHYTETYEK